MTVRLRRWMKRTARHRLRPAAGVAAVALLTLVVASCSDVFGTGGDIEILWPRRNATMYDVEVLRAYVRHRDLDDYEIYWSIDGGRERRMYDEWYDHTPHKVYSVDTWYWDWNGRGPYTIRFVAEDYRGRRIAQRTVRVYVE